MMYGEDELRALAAILVENDVYILADELYEKIVFDGNKHVSIGSFDETRDLTVTVNGCLESLFNDGVAHRIHACLTGDHQSREHHSNPIHHQRDVVRAKRRGCRSSARGGGFASHGCGVPAPARHHYGALAGYSRRPFRKAARRVLCVDKRGRVSEMLLIDRLPTGQLSWHNTRSGLPPARRLATPIICGFRTPVRTGISSKGPPGLRRGSRPFRSIDL